MKEILQKAQEIINEATSSDSFHFDYADSLFATGERSVDYSAYCIDLNSEYFIIIDFSDFSFDGFSIVKKEHNKHLFPVS